MDHDLTKKRCLEHTRILLADPLGDAGEKFHDEGSARGGKEDSRARDAFYILQGWQRPHKSGTGDHKTVGFAPREYISPPSSRSVSPGVSNVASRQNIRRPLSFLPSFLLFLYLSFSILRRTMENT